jgi:hypothetical protein
LGDDGKKKKTGYQPRDDDFRKWIFDENRDLNSMTWDEIKRQLIVRNSGLWTWTSGFHDWKKQQNIHKSSLGRRQGK